MSSPQTIDLADAYRRLAKRHADLLIVADVLEEQLVQSRQQLVDLSARLNTVEQATVPLPFPGASDALDAGAGG